MRLIKLIGLLLYISSVLHASTLVNKFDFHAQEFSELSEVKQHSYKVNEDYIVTLLGTVYEDNSFGSSKSTALIELNFVQNNPKNWVLNESFYIQGRGEARYLKFIDVDGLQYVITFKRVYMYVGDKKVVVNTKEYSNLKFLFTNNKMTVYNGNKVVASEKIRFSKLKYIKQSFRGQIGQGQNINEFQFSVIR